MFSKHNELVKTSGERSRQASTRVFIKRGIKKADASNSCLGSGIHWLSKAGDTWCLSPGDLEKPLSRVTPGDVQVLGKGLCNLCRFF